MVTQSSHNVKFNKYDYYIDVVDMSIYINVESLTDGIIAPFIYISRSNRYPSNKDSTYCDNEVELNEWGSVCTMAYTDIPILIT